MPLTATVKCAVPALVACALGTAGCGSDDAEPPRPEPPVSVSPSEPSATDTITVRARTLYGRGKPGDSGNYHFNLAGPTGENCDERFESAVGMHAWEGPPTTERGGEVVVRRYCPTRVDQHPLTRERNGATWCPGTYTGAVEWRVPGAGFLRRRELPNGIVVWGKLLDTYSFEIAG